MKKINNIMTQEEKDLLLKDLCARIPYGVKCQCFDEGTIASLTGVKSNTELYFAELDFKEFDGIVKINYCKPYLYPLSSITEAQKEEYYSLADDVTIKPGKGSYFGIKIHCIKLGISENPHEGVWDWIDLDAIDWLNKNHFDYIGLIPKGLANDATGLNIY